MAGLHSRQPLCAWRQRGLGLPETLIAFTLMLVALTGLLAAHQQAKLLQRDASQRLEAILALRELSQRWQLNTSAASSYRAGIAQGLVSAGNDFRCSQDSCTAAARAQADVAWVAASLQGLTRAQWQIQPCRDWLADCLWLGWGSAANDCDGQHAPLRFERCLQWLLPP
ncbi:MAG: hypothetical protein ABIR53_03010, partial [Paraperlucidibaca sp.]